MTTVYLTEKKCFICGEKNQYPLTNFSLDTIGTRDLDGRPSYIRRSAVYLWIQRCISCGYCSMEIAEGFPEFKDIIALPQYIQQLSNSEYPETANAFLCFCMLMEHIENFADAGWAAVFASWICDDNSYIQAAANCRDRALVLFERAKENGQKIWNSPADEKIFFIDLHRRRGEFEKAAVICDAELGKQHPPRVVDLLYFERELIEKCDIACHTDVEAEESEI